jgi:GTP-binding protein
MLLMKKRAIVAESSRSAKAAEISRAPGPLERATFVTGAAEASQLPAEGAPEIAFAGRSNSGKSSAINALARQTRLAHASRTPGRTRQINFFQLESGALVTDLPGYGYAAVPRALKRSWQDFLWSYVTTRSTLVGLVLIVDARHGLKSLDTDLLEAFLPSGRPVLILATKIDKLNVAERRRAVADIRAALAQRFGERARTVSATGFSATSRQGVEDADRTIAQWLGTGEGSIEGADRKRPRDQGE